MLLISIIIAVVACFMATLTYVVAIKRRWPVVTDDHGADLPERAKGWYVSNANSFYPVIIREIHNATDFYFGLKVEKTNQIIELPNSGSVKVDLFLGPGESAPILFVAASVPPGSYIEDSFGADADLSIDKKRSKLPLKSYFWPTDEQQGVFLRLKILRKAKNE